MVKFLLENGADKDIEGETEGGRKGKPLDIVMSNRKQSKDDDMSASKAIVALLAPEDATELCRELDAK